MIYLYICLLIKYTLLYRDSKVFYTCQAFRHKPVLHAHFQRAIRLAGSNTDDQSRAVKRSKVGSPITDGEKSEGVTKTDTAVNDHISEAETPETAARYCELYCALCTKRHALLRELFSTFGECRGLGRAAILRNAEGLARVLGPQAPSLLELVAQRPTGSSPLLLKMLNQLTETQTPPKVSFWILLSFAVDATRHCQSLYFHQIWKILGKWLVLGSWQSLSD